MSKTHKQTQPILFENADELRGYNEEWKDMPEFKHEDLRPDISIIVHFRNEEDRKAFSELVAQKITYKTKSIWYPQNEIAVVANKIYTDSTEKNTEHES